ncbi:MULTISPECIES: hypothetical protein [Clostridium]|uniref:hypothetical protein n=1 Tax=Clostridium TaxID=1485 RepID=UPI00082668D5|nr:MULTISPECIES: hypothetical protein [Clostridium]PJI10237.1 hypothetical protein CUB90_21200 [Clostridium sp. CT7]
MKRKFYTETWFMWLMLFLFAPLGIILLVKYHKGSELKKSLISLVFIFIFFIEIGIYTGVGASSNKKVTSRLPKETTEKVTYKKLSASDRDLLKMKYSDFNDDEKTQFSKIEEEYGELSSKDQASISDDYRRLENEKEDAETTKSQNNNTQNSPTNQPAQQPAQQQQNSTASQPQQNTQQNQQQNAQPASKAVQQPSQDQNQSQTVYITKTGKKYHRAGCRYLSRSQIPISLKDAQSEGYTPCEICNP